MCTLVANSASRLTEVACNLASKACTTVSDAKNSVSQAYNCISRKVSCLTDDKLPQPLAKFVKEAVCTLPYTASALALRSAPLYVGIGAVATYGAIHVYKEWAFSPKTYSNLWSGVSLAATISAIQNSKAFIQSKDTSSLVYAVALTLLAALTAVHSDRFKKIATAIDDPTSSSSSSSSAPALNFSSTTAGGTTTVSDTPQ